MGLFDKKNTNSASGAKLGAMLKEAFPGVEFFQEGDGHFAIREDSVAVSIFINKDFGDGTNVVSVVGLTLFGARDVDGLYRHLMVNTETGIQAHWEVEPAEATGTVNVMVVQNLLLETLDVLELQVAVGGVVDSANNNDENLQKLFGGRRCVEEYGWSE